MTMSAFPVLRSRWRQPACRLLFVAVHSAHWAAPFTALMDERARADVRRQFADVPADKLSITEVPGPRKVPNAAAARKRGAVAAA
jgi:hypothetical protein